MISLIISLLVVLWGWSGVKKHQWRFICAAVCLLTNLFGLNFPESSVKYYDFFVMLMAYPLLFYVRWKDVICSFKEDKVEKVILVINLYVLFSFLWTVLIGNESFSYAFKVFRTYWYLWAYYFLKTIPYGEYKKSFKYLFRVTIVCGVLFILQLFGIELLAGGKEFDVSSGQVERMRNIPKLTIVLMFSLLFPIAETKARILLGLMWAGILVLSQHRGMMLSLCMAIPILYLVRGKLGKIIKVGVVGAIIVIIFSPLLMQRFGKDEGGMSLTQEISKGLDFSDVKYEDATDGTFLFRSFLIQERVEYMLEHPINFVFGCGMMHEDSPATARRFKFLVGTKKFDPQTGAYSIQQQISTSDVAFLTNFMRFGLVFIFLLLVLFFNMYKRVYKSLDSSFASNILFLILTYYLLRTLSGDEFTNLAYMMLYSFVICSTKSIKSILYGNNNYSCSNIQSDKLSKKGH